MSRSNTDASDVPEVVVGLGEILWDLLPSGRKLGGAPANFAYHARCLGCEAFVVSCVGTDLLGEEIARRLDELGVRRDYLAVSGSRPTGTVEVRLDERGQPEFIIHTDVAWDAIPWTPALGRLAERCDAVCFGSLCQRSEVSRRTVERFLGATRPECLRVFDINLRQHWYSEAVVRRSLEAARILKLNEDELPIVAEMFGLHGDQDAVLVSLLRTFDLDLVALTRGEHGSVLRTPQQRSEHPGVKVDVSDTVGAGDAFTAALVVGLLRGFDLDRINGIANRLGAWVAARDGATPPVPESFVRELLGG